MLYMIFTKNLYKSSNKNIYLKKDKYYINHLKKTRQGGYEENNI
jgi:hypothetical protein